MNITFYIASKWWRGIYLFIARRRREKIANTVLISIGKHVSRTRIVIKFMVHSILYNSIRSRSWDHRLQNLVNVSCIIILRPRWNRTMLFTYWIFTQWSVIVWSIFINNNVLDTDIWTRRERNIRGRQCFKLLNKYICLIKNPWFQIAYLKYSGLLTSGCRSKRTDIVFQLSSEAMVLFQNWFKAQRPFCFTPVPSGDILRPVTSQYQCCPGYWIIA